MSETLPSTNDRSFFRFLRFRNWRLAPKLIVAFLLVALVPTGMTAVGMTQSARDALLSQGAVSLVSSSHNTSVALDQYLNAKVEDLVVLSKLSTFQNYSGLSSISLMDPADRTLFSSARNELQTLAAKADYESIAIINMQGTILLSSLPGEVSANVSGNRYFQEAARGQTYISDPAFSATSNAPAIYFSTPIRGVAGGPASEKIIAVARSCIRLDGIWALVERDNDGAGQGTFGILLDENGLRISTGQSSNNRERILEELLYSAVAPLAPQTEQKLIGEGRLRQGAKSIRVVPLPEVANVLGAPGSKTFETTADNSNERHYAAIAKMSSKPWSYVLMTPLSKFTGTADTFRLVWVLFASIVAVFTAIGALIVARGIATPIVHLTRLADRISMGELDAQIDINRGDEIGELADAVSRMQASIQVAMERLHSRRTGP
jgi:HAMP domain-containing protein